MTLFATKDFRNSFYDGMFANMFATLTGGLFLTGFAVYLGMNEFMIGILGAIPFMVTIFQLPTSYLLHKDGKRKRTAYLASAAARLTWIVILLFALFPVRNVSAKCVGILSLIFLSHAFASVSYVAWLSWTSDLVPEKIRGRFFGTRNMLCGAAGIVAILVFGRLLDDLRSGSHGLTFGFSITFLSAVAFGMLSLRYLNQIREVPIDTSVDHVPFRKNLRLLLKDRNFRNFLAFTCLWNFSVYFASPFFTLYFLRDLNFSYGFVAVLAMISSLADLLGMRVWGKISDRVRNRAIIRVASWVVVFLPLAWSTVSPGSTIMPVFLQLVGGSFWAGINLCMNNFLLGISPRQNRGLYISLYSIAGGGGASIGPILAGFTVTSLIPEGFRFLSWDLLPLKVIFLTSTVLRCLSLRIFKYVSEPEEVTVGHMVRTIRSVRGLNVANGFNNLLHPVLENSRNKLEPQEPGEAEPGRAVTK
jgi:MFS family permease